MRVSASGGVPAVVVPARDGELLDGPQLLPGGRAILVTSARAVVNNQRWDEAQILVHQVDSGQRKILWSGGSSATYVSSGHLVYAVKDALFALPFDVDTLETSGQPVQLVSRVHRPPTPWLQAGYASYGVSDRGSLVYVRSEEVGWNRVLAFVDRKGVVRRIDIPPAPYVNARLSPAGNRLLVQTLDADGRTDIWMYELSGNKQIRQLTLDGRSRYPLWTPDGTRVTFVSDREGTPAIYWQRIDGHAAERLTAPAPLSRPDAWSPDGSILAYRIARGTDESIWTLRAGRGSSPELFDDVPNSSQYEAAFSPDGKWLAYTSAETGADEVFVQPFPATGVKVRVTQQGGAFPIWSPDGRELIYRRSFDKNLNRSRGASLFAVDIGAAGGVVEFGPERVLPLEGFMVFNTYRDYDITRDNRFLMVYPSERSSGALRITVVQNWFEELKARVPAK
jgi:dipeptidyl aminopeptidase/acylaminoacyl peptidase